MSRTEPEIDPKESEIFRLGDFVFYKNINQLRGPGGGRVPLRSQSTQVLALLLQHRGEVVSKDALVEAVWQDTFVTDDSLVQCIADIRRALGDAGHEIVQSVPKQGYLVVATLAGDEGRGARAAARGPIGLVALALLLALIAPEAGAAFRDDPDCGAIRQQLKADYILTGTAQRYNDRIRITTAFLDAKTCRQLTPPGPP